MAEPLAALRESVFSMVPWESRVVRMRVWISSEEAIGECMRRSGDARDTGGDASSMCLFCVALLSIASPANHWRESLDSSISSFPGRASR
jgi:hypothetical protein